MSDSSNIAGRLEELALRYGDRPAIIDGTAGTGNAQKTTYRELLDRVRAAAALWRARGLQPGDSALVLVPMSARLYEVLLGLWWAGLTAVVPGPVVNRHTIAQACQATDPRALIAPTRLHLVWPFLRGTGPVPLRFTTGAWLPWARRWQPAVAASGRGGGGQGGAGDGPAPCGADTPALVTFTSGSTGAPKAAVRTHGFLLAQHRALTSGIDLAAGEVDLTTLPVFLLANLASGLTSVIPEADLRAPAAIDPAPVLAQVLAHKITRTTASPAFLERLADHCLRHGTTLHGLDKVYVGGAPVFPRLLGKLARVAPRARVVSVYGSTEAEPIAHVAWSDTTEADRAAMRQGAGLLAGVPEPSVQVRILRQPWGQPIAPQSPTEFAARCQPTGQPGEIVVSGDHVLQGYLHGQGDAQTKFEAKGRTWHRTGDAGYLDAGGRLWLLGRCEARITRPSGSLFPLAAECAIHDVAGLTRSALVEHAGQTVLAVELAPGAQVGAVEQAVRQRLPWAAIGRVLVLPRIPVDRRHNAKVDYPRLRTMVRRCVG